MLNRVGNSNIFVALNLPKVDLIFAIQMVKDSRLTLFIRLIWEASKQCPVLTAVQISHIDV